ncbi:diguanylate cyclase [Amphritea sp. 1_MG-2023]|uniref:GGDEF domain-containing protein n=1 Tax=Amphritea sp. 1_MG-2023 TaxID=3062670 RepID=UPI0026E1C45B|nr:sensor domain-containing diguanylate cyclase [Amphritea sp. 1_MG-2023]MDO6564648.1 diguanylate cyclase [Amphritea sp. 1_MG-2023]
MTLNTILDLIVEGTWDWDSATGTVIRSPSWYRMLGYPIGELLPDVFTWEKSIHCDDYARVMAHIEQYIKGEIDTYCIQYRCQKQDGSYLWIEDRAQAVSRNSEGVATRLIGAHHNIHAHKVIEQQLQQQTRLLEEGNQTLEKLLARKAEELELKNKQLEEQVATVEKLSQTDVLTQVANREKVNVEMVKEIARSERYNHPLSLMFIDINNFKFINDTHGHKVGDAVLVTLAKVIAANLRSIDCLARWGGDEFLIILPSSDIHQASDVAAKLNDVIANTHFSDNIELSCSFGVVEYQQNETVDDFFHRVDQAMYQDKEAS